MRDRSYLDFDLLIERGPGEHTYQARVVAAPSGPTAPAAFALPFSDLELENFLLKIGRPRKEAARGLGTSQTAAIETFGESLFTSLFSGDLKVTLATSLAQADGEDVGLRLRLRLTDVPELADIPWEFLRDPAERRFLALSEWTPLVRYLDLPGRLRPLTVSPPLRILVVVASPIDLVRLDTQAELMRLREALGGLEASGKVIVDAAPAGTLSALSRNLRRGDYHVFHFIGHGGYDVDADDGLVAFEDADGRFQEVRASHLGMLLHDHRTLRMAVLNSCEGARGSLHDPYAGTAQTLVRQGVPAVIAMQFEITDDAAIAFSQTLYEAIADGYPIDAAMAQARMSICSDVNDVEWATPVLYLRAPDGRVFDVVTAQETVSPSGPNDVAVLADDPAYAAALSESSAGRWHEVVRLLAEVQTRFPDEVVIAEQLTNARRQLQLAMLDIRARAAAREERWQDTQFALERIVEIDPGYAGASDRLTELRERPKESPAPPLASRSETVSPLDLRDPGSHLDEPRGGHGPTVDSRTPPRRTERRRRQIVLLGAAVVALVLAGLVVAYLRPSGPAPLGDEWILYTTQGSEGPRLWAVSSLNGDRKHIPTPGNADIASISRDRRSIAYVRVRAGTDPAPRGPLRLVALDGHDTPLFEHDAACDLGRQRVSWGPKDAQIAERCTRKAGEALYLRDKTGKVTFRADGVTRNPTFSPDGKFVIFWRPPVRRSSEVPGLYAVPVGDQSLIGLVTAASGAGGAPPRGVVWSEPAWAPHPTSHYRLAFVSHPKGDRSDTTLYTAEFTPEDAGGGTLEFTCGGAPPAGLGQPHLVAGRVEDRVPAGRSDLLHARCANRLSAVSGRRLGTGLVLLLIGPWRERRGGSVVGAIAVTCPLAAIVELSHVASRPHSARPRCRPVRGHGAAVPGLPAPRGRCGCDDRRARPAASARQEGLRPARG